MHKQQQELLTIEFECCHCCRCYFFHSVFSFSLFVFFFFFKRLTAFLTHFKLTDTCKKSEQEKKRSISRYTSLKMNRTKTYGYCVQHGMFTVCEAEKKKQNRGFKKNKTKNLT